MDLIEWSDGYSVGIESIDQQHQKIINLINSLAENPDNLSNSKVVSALLNEMISYALEHFNFEEALLKENGYPDFDNHHAKHVAYSKKIGNLCAASMSHTKVTPEELKENLCDWWIQHILKEDMAYSKFFNERGIAL